MVDLEIPELEGFKQDALFISISLLLVAGIAGAHNLATVDDPTQISPVKMSSECAGIDVGFCLGIQKYDHNTSNYDNYTTPEPGTEDFYERVESQLMIQAYETCEEDVEGEEWKEMVEYRNQTASEWEDNNEEVDLWSCEKTFHRNMTEG